MTPAPTREQVSMYNAPSQKPSFIISDYYPSWKVYNGRKPSDLRLELLTHHRDVKADTEVVLDGIKGALPALVKLRNERNPDLRVLLSIGGGSGSKYFAAVAAHEPTTTRFCETASDLVKRFGLDGIDIDWEHPQNAVEGQSFGRLIHALRKYLPRPRYIITAALAAGEWCLRHIDLSSLLAGPSSPLNHINVMTYDFAGSWTNGQSGHHACLFAPAKAHNQFAKRSISNAFQYLTQSCKISPSKIVIGIPVYGRAFGGTKGPGEKFTVCTTHEYQHLPLQGAIESVDQVLGAASCYGYVEGQPHWVSYDNPTTVLQKSRFAIDNKAGGVFFWTTALDAEGDSRSLLVTAHQSLCGS